MHVHDERQVWPRPAGPTPYDRVTGRLSRAAIAVAVAANVVLLVAIEDLGDLPDEAQPHHLSWTGWWPWAVVLAATGLILVVGVWWRRGSRHAHVRSGPSAAWSIALLVVFAVVAIGFTARTANAHQAEAHTSTCPPAEPGSPSGGGCARR